MVLAQDAVAGKGDPSLSPSDCQAPQLYNKALVRGKILICTYSFDYVFGGSTMQQLVITIKTLGAAGVAMVVDSDTSGGKFEPIPLAIPVIVFPTSVDSQVRFSPLLGQLFSSESPNSHRQAHRTNF
jgi:hypothetical protein